MEPYIEPVISLTEEAGQILKQIPEESIKNAGVNLVSRITMSMWTKLRGSAVPETSDHTTGSQINPANKVPDHSEVLTQLRLAEAQVDSLRRNVHRCECDDSKSCSVYCNHKFKLTQLATIGVRLESLFAQLPLSDEKVQQHIDEVWKCMNTLALAVAKYGEGIDVPRVLPLSYKDENNDDFQQRFKSSIIGLEACLA
jgi:hypothetical protein